MFQAGVKGMSERASSLLMITLILQLSMSP